MMMIVITIINSSSVNPARLRAQGKKVMGKRESRGNLGGRISFPFSRFPFSPLLPVTIFLTIQRRLFRLRAHIKNILAAPGAAVCRVVARAKVPVGLAGHGVDWDAAKIDLLFSGQLRIPYVRRVHCGDGRARCVTADRYDLYAVYQGLKV